VVAADNTVITRDAVRIGATARSVDSSETGYTMLQSTLVGETPAGFDVWVDPRAPHHWAIARSAASSVRSLHALGTRIRYRGYGTPAAGEGLVQIREGTRGCGNGGGTIGMTWTYWKTIDASKRYVYRADVYLCPKLFQMATWATAATVGHELGHAMGLGHTNYRYLGSYQLMNAVVRKGVASYQKGDRAGLIRLARNSNWVKTEIPPAGKLDASSWQNDGTILFRGWALLKYFRSDPVRITLTDNGQVIATTGTPVLRSDVNRSYDPGQRPHGYAITVPWTGGTHAYCVNASSARHPSASTELGCVTWRG
jgi:hypothetical protein